MGKGLCGRNGRRYRRIRKILLRKMEGKIQKQRQASECQPYPINGKDGRSAVVRPIV